MTHQDWINLFAPAVAALVLAIAGALAAILSGLSKKASAWLTSHNEAAVAAAVASAGQVINRALDTSASVIAGKIQSGELDYTNRAALTAEAERELALVKTRVPDMLAVVASADAPLISAIMGKVDAQVVASPTLPLSPPPLSSPTGVKK